MLLRMQNFASCSGPTHTMTPSPISTCTQDSPNTYLCVLFHRNASKPVLQLKTHHYPPNLSFRNPDLPTKYCNNPRLLEHIHPEITKASFLPEKLCILFQSSPSLQSYVPPKTSYHSPLFLTESHKCSLAVKMGGAYQTERSLFER